jgi:hypothetical protein
MCVATKILVAINPTATTVLRCYCHPSPWKCFGGKRSYCNENHLRGSTNYANEVPCVAIRSMATNKIARQMVVLPQYGTRGNYIWSLATNNIAWKMILLQRNNNGGNNIWSLTTNKIMWQIMYLPQHGGHGNNTAFATTVNVVTTSYCHAWQRIGMVARNPNSCNTKLATVAIPYCNVTFCNHWQRTWFGCNIFLLQPNWVYCIIFSSLRKG